MRKIIILTTLLLLVLLFSCSGDDPPEKDKIPPTTPKLISHLGILPVKLVTKFSLILKPA